MTKDEALKLALEALENPNDIDECNRSKYDLAITAIKQALAAPTVQEPMAITYKEVADAMNALWGGTLKQLQIAEDMANRKLYTTPPAVPLTPQVTHLPADDSEGGLA